MRTKLEATLLFAATSLAPVAAYAEPQLMQAAGNGPWITLAVIGMVRALAGFAELKLGEDA